MCDAMVKMDEGLRLFGSDGEGPFVEGELSSSRTVSMHPAWYRGHTYVETTRIQVHVLIVFKCC